MERIRDLTKDEIVKLTNEQVEKLIDLECAFEGIPLLPPQPVEPGEPNIKPDVTAYEIGGFYFLNYEEAGKVLAALKGTTVYGYNYESGYHQKRLVPLKDYELPKITTVQMFSAEYLDAMKPIVTKYNTLKKQYNEEKAHYDEIFNKRKEIADMVWEIVNNARKEYQRIMFLQGEFERYKALADNNTEIAMRFLINAYPTIETELPELIQAFNRSLGGKNGQLPHPIEGGACKSSS